MIHHFYPISPAAPTMAHAASNATNATRAGSLGQQGGGPVQGSGPAGAGSLVGNLVGWGSKTNAPSSAPGAPTSGASTTPPPQGLVIKDGKHDRVLCAAIVPPHVSSNYACVWWSVGE
jgi:hypothetical protein